MSAVDKSKCGWIRATKRHRASVQRKALEAAGCGVIYEDGIHETFDDLLRSRRPGDTIYVATLGRLGRTREEIHKRVKDLHARQCTIVETTTGRSSGDKDQLFDMGMEATAEVNRDARALPSKLAKEFGRRGAEATAARARERRMPEKEAKQVWLGHPKLTNREVLDLMPGWTERAAYRHLGQRDLAKGRPRKRQD